MNKLVDNLLSSVRYATISTTDSKRRAWAAPVWYVFDEDNTLYWWSPINSQHSKNIEENGDCYITIFDSTVQEGDGFGVYIRATAQRIPESRIDAVTELYNKSTNTYKLDRTNTTGDAPTRLYQATSLSVQINDSIEINGFYKDIRRDTN